MDEQTNPPTQQGPAQHEEWRHHGKWKHKYHHHSGGAVYGLGFIGAVIYFLQHSTTFWLGVLGILKAIVWPAFVVYKALEFLRL